MKSVPRLGSAVVVRNGDTVLVARRAKEPNFGKWVFPGGKIEAFETIKAAGQREILEETGLRVEIGNQIGAFEIIEPPNEHRVIIYSWARPLEGTPVPATDVSELRYCTRDELSRMDLSAIVADVARSIGWLDPAETLAA
jgi:8-oxo-dGTP diphosphatase